MRVTGSRTYTRPTPVPKMPPGLVELMEGLSKEILRTNPSDVYDFCATHMQKLLEIRDGPPTTKRMQSLSLDQKIANAQNKVRQRAENRRQKYDHEADIPNGKDVCEIIGLEGKNLDLSEHENLIENVPKGPVHHELGLADDSEIEIAHELALNSRVTEIIDHDQQNDIRKELSKEKETIILNEDFGNITMSNIECLQDNVLVNHQEKNTYSEDYKNDDKTKEPNTEFTMAHKNTVQIDADVINVIKNLEDKTIPLETKKDGQENDILCEIALEPHRPIVVVDDTVQKTPLLTSNVTDSHDPKIEAINVVKNDEGTKKKENTQSLFVVVPESHFLKEVVEDTDQKTTLTSSNTTDLQNSEKEDTNVVNEVTNKIQIDTQSVHVVAELQQPQITPESAQLPECNIVSESTKQEKMEQDDNITFEAAATAPIIYLISREQETEPKLNEMAGKEQMEKVNYEMQLDSTAEDTTAVVKSEELSDKVCEEYQNNTEDLNNKTNTSNSPIEILEAAENKQLVTTSAIDTSTGIFPSVAGVESKFHVDIEENNETTLDFEMADDSKLENVEDFPRMNNEEINSKDNKNNEVQNTSPEIHEIAANVERAVEKSKTESYNKNSTTNVLEDTPKVKKDNIIRSDVRESSNMDLETAAITIQKVFRTFLFKSRASTFEDSVNDEANSIDEDNENKDMSEYTITSSLKDRRSLGITRMDTVLQTVNEEKSLSLSTDDSSTLSSAATIIQAHVRGYLVRNKLNSNKTVSSNSMLNSDGPNSKSLDNDTNPQKKTVLNIHIIPEGGNLSRDESLITSMDLSLDGSPPLSINLHPLGYDINERRKQLKREDAFQSISPPSNNSGKLSEDVDSVIEQCATDGNSHSKNNSIEKTDVEIRGVTPDENIADESVSNGHSSSTETSLQQFEINLKNKRKSLHKMSSDEMDVVTPFGENEQKNESNLENNPKLLHSGELHDIVLPTKVSRSDTSVVREFKTVLVYFLIWNK